MDIRTKQTFKVVESGPQHETISHITVETDRTAEWTIDQYLRNRANTTMTLVSEKEI